MTAWRLAGSLKVLLAETNARWPHRDHASDGTIGDARHQAEPTSDHNPFIHDHLGVPVVRAADVDSGPGLNPDEAHDGIGDAVALAALRALHANIADPTRHRAMGQGAYLIHEHQIASHKTGGLLIAYHGSDPHTSHPHISVALAQRGYDDTESWGIFPVPKPAVVVPAPAPAVPVVVAPKPAPVVHRVAVHRPVLWMGQPRGPKRRHWVRVAQQHLGVSPDGRFGRTTRRAVIAYRRKHHLGRPFSVIGPRVWASLISGKS